jgi:hypothetical protein
MADRWPRVGVADIFSAVSAIRRTGNPANRRTGEPANRLTG